MAANTVRPRAQELYSRSVRQLLACVGLKTAPKERADFWDEMLGEYLNH